MGAVLAAGPACAGAVAAAVAAGIAVSVGGHHLPCAVRISAGAADVAGAAAGWGEARHCNSLILTSYN